VNNPLIELVFVVVRVLDGIAIPYALGGSLASSVFGEPRATMDIDIAAKVGPEQIDPLLTALSEHFYVPEQTARAACTEGGSFNVLDVETGYKVDVFVVSETLLDRRQIERRITTPLGDEGRVIDVTAPDDQLLRKLEWFRAGGETSDQQWRDILGLLTMSAERMDFDDLTRTARALGLDDLLAEAITQSEIG
jgi:hypothetical protein